jgi:hypothetical protein
LNTSEPPTPRATEAILAATVLATVSATLAFELARPDSDVDAGFAAGFLWLFSALFLVRVAGQLVARELEPAWLPPTRAWNLTPYRLLLPVQLGILALMAWIDFDLSREAGYWADPKPRFGEALRWFAYVYAAVMAARYVVRMRRRPDQRWFGGAIPIVFHWVLAAYLYVLGSFHASY